MDRIKYPRTMNFSWSQSNSSDDVWLKDDSIFTGREVVITDKLDGECTTLYPDRYMHARSRDYSPHPSRDWIKNFQATISHLIPEGWRICGENVYAFHSILYTDLPSYFFVFGIYDENNICISWDDVEEYCKLLGLQTVPVLYRGLWENRPEWTGQGTFPTYAATTESHFKFPDTFTPCEAEGYVVRLAEAFPYDEFGKKVGKYVRANHVTTPTNWMTRPVFPNILQVTNQ